MKKFQYIIMGLAIAFVGCNNSKSERAFNSTENNEEISEPAIEVYTEDPNEDVSVVVDGEPIDTVALFAQQEASINETANQGHAGTYEVTDLNGKKWTFVLNPDETVVIKDGGNTYYGTWKDYSTFDDNPRIKFPTSDYPKLQFPKTERFFDAYLAIDVVNSYIYGNSADNSIYKSKNPKKRLPIKKIK